MRSQVNMMWSNMPRHHLLLFFPRIVELWITFLSRRAVTNLYAMKQIIFFFPDFVDKNVLTQFKHDVHVCVFTMIYMFVNCICTKYIKVCIH